IKYCLPEGCRPIILADAIFKTPWLKAIENRGWYWVCRVRGNVQLSKDGENWQPSREWFLSANSKAVTLGDIYFSKTTQHPCIG
ncbi:transposase, partial [Pseudoalteromonas sp. Q36-MNA-CIBAN-0048]|uniref:transposase n=1 Tax=Pseudoalteromonas sp. Q36-MNA-CIBAN-0048 TaxID=3140479 RepID=UPI003319F98D